MSRPPHRRRLRFGARLLHDESETVKHLDPIFAAPAPQPLDFAAAAMTQDPQLSWFVGRDAVKGRCTISASVVEGVPAHVLSSALHDRFSSRGEADFADKMLSAMRYNQIGAGQWQSNKII
jgi:hypothetical protein